MVTNNSPITLREYLKKGKTFVVPYYQRGYIWGKEKATGYNSSAKTLENLLLHYGQKEEIFLQGITVAEPDDGENKGKIVLIDGQQRTTFLYLLLNFLGYPNKFDIDYSIRKSSEQFLKDVRNAESEGKCENCIPADDVQDVYYFKKTMLLFNRRLVDVDKKNFLEYLLDNIKFLYIVIPEEKAISIFSMMNANRAKMKDEEIIKAELLRLVSLDDAGAELSGADQIAADWEHNELRSRYAREWDKWLYWWRRDDVQTFYHIDEKTYPLNILISTYYKKKGNNKGKYNFENLKNSCLRDIEKNIREDKLAKDAFYELRCIQKNFEDVFNSIKDSSHLHNYIGGILYRLDNANRNAFIQSYFANNELTDEEIKEYFKMVFLGLSHKEAKEELELKITLISESGGNLKAESDEAVQLRPVEKHRLDLLAALSDNDLYHSNYQEAFWQLLRINLECDTVLNRAFDFSIEKEKSLEHIHPQSKVYYEKNGKFYSDKDNKELGSDICSDKHYINRKDFENADCSQHSIGNLVLLYKNENSKFNNSDFEEKKKIYFDTKREEYFRSRNLLHSLSVFAHSSWGINEIKDNKDSLIDEIKKYYGYQEQ